MRLGSVALAIALLGGACNAQITDGLGNNLASVDAAPGGGSVDAAIDAPPTIPVCARRSVFLNFDGVTLAKGPSDATINQASWLLVQQSRVPAYHLTGDPDPAGSIKTIVDGVRAQLSQFPITVVTTRPSSGEYVMIAFGGIASVVGSRFGPAVNTLDCGDAQHNDVAWVADAVSPPQRVINTVVGAIGFGLGLTATADPMDCMCNWDNTCQPIDTAACTLGSPIARDPTARQRCDPLTTQDEVGTLRDAFCK